MSFLDFTTELLGYKVFNYRTNKTIPKYILYWSGYSIEQIKKDFRLIDR